MPTLFPFETAIVLDGLKKRFLGESPNAGVTSKAAAAAAQEASRKRFFEEPQDVGVTSKDAAAQEAYRKQVLGESPYVGVTSNGEWSLSPTTTQAAPASTKGASNNSPSNLEPTNLTPVATTTPATVVRGNTAIPDFNTQANYTPIDNVTRCEMAGGKNCNQNPFYGLDNLYEANIRRNDGRESVFNIQSRAFMDKLLGGDWQTQLGKEQQRGDLLAVANATSTPEAQQYIVDLMKNNNLSLNEATAIARDKVLTDQNYNRANTLYNFPTLDKALGTSNLQNSNIAYFTDTPFVARPYEGFGNSGVSAFDPTAGTMTVGGNIFKNVNPDQLGETLGLTSKPISTMNTTAAKVATDVGMQNLKNQGIVNAATLKAQGKLQEIQLEAQVKSLRDLSKSTAMTPEQQVDLAIKEERLKELKAKNAALVSEGEPTEESILGGN